ncbi:hypothetical protein [Sediminibacterium salmoneum]|uniref:hypothetical protein n=1 Tax=Sediminibacterium salmoneum TaxID=426421 RepID=UPI0004B5F6F5|nr:hypothetical protein [Sediminibacterium salmoneum]
MEIKNEILIIEAAVGYMLKVIKSGKRISKFKTEFSAIRHGNYFEFINLVKGPLPFMVTYRNGAVYVDDKNNQDDFDFAGLFKAGASLKIFYDNCIDFYGEIIDSDISDLTYCKLAYFEISLRMHSNNKNLVAKEATLEKVIDAIVLQYSLSMNESQTLHSGRKFLNMVKHYKSQFKTWADGTEALKNALYLIVKKNLTIK